MGDSAVMEEPSAADLICPTCSRTMNRSPTPGAHSAKSSLNSLQTNSSPMTSRPHVVYIVTDTRYPTEEDFSNSKGTFSIDSVHSNKRSANIRAKKIIFQGGKSTVDVDKVIEEVDQENGFYTGIGIGGTADGQAGNAYARKCGVESKFIDEDSDDEAEEELISSQENQKIESDGHGDVEMG